MKKIIDFENMEKINKKIYLKRKNLGLIRKELSKKNDFCINVLGNFENMEADIAIVSFVKILASLNLGYRVVKKKDQ